MSVYESYDILNDYSEEVRILKKSKSVDVLEKGGLVIRIYLPNGASTLLNCDEKWMLTDVLNKALFQSLGVAFSNDEYIVYPGFNSMNEGQLKLEASLCDQDYIQTCVSHSATPTISIVWRDLLLNAPPMTIKSNGTLGGKSRKRSLLVSSNSFQSNLNSVNGILSMDMRKRAISLETARPILVNELQMALENASKPRPQHIQSYTFEEAEIVNITILIPKEEIDGKIELSLTCKSDTSFASVKHMIWSNNRVGWLQEKENYSLAYRKDGGLVEIFDESMIILRQEMAALLGKNEEDEAKIASKIALVPRNYSVKVYFNFGDSKIISVAADATPCEVKAKIYEKCKFHIPHKLDELELKLRGVCEFFTSNSRRLLEYSSIQRAIQMNVDIELALNVKRNLKIESPADEYLPIEYGQYSIPHHRVTLIGNYNLSGLQWLSLWDVTRNFRIQILTAQNLKVVQGSSLYIEAGIFHGGKPLCPKVCSPDINADENVLWKSWLIFDFAICNLPRTTRICVTLFQRLKSKRSENESEISPVGWFSSMLIDYKGVLKSGLKKRNLWRGCEANPIGAVTSPPYNESGTICFRFDEFAVVKEGVEERRIVSAIFPSLEYFVNQFDKGNANTHLEKTIRQAPMPSIDRVELMEAIWQSHPLKRIDTQMRTILWKYRYRFMGRSEALPKILLCTNWSDIDQVIEAYVMMKHWERPLPEVAMELLDYKFNDKYVRQFAVSCLESLSDEEVLNYLLQRTEALTFDPYLDSALVQFLLKRALQNKNIGHYFFWYLNSMMKEPTVSLKCALILEAFLKACGSQFDDFKRQVDLVSSLTFIANQVKECRSPVTKTGSLQEGLGSIKIPEPCSLPINPKLKVKGLLTDQCKYMDSKKQPLWCAFENADPTANPIYVIFKTGDDLRQDILTLQMIRIMDNLWKKEGLDLQMTPYGCVMLEKDVGMIEVVLKARTVSNIQIAYGGSSAAFKDDVMAEWIRRHNTSDEDYAKAVDLFTRSCAGYCVATYVLGIGDRHNDNIMVTESGRLFHIDFGHFLGNIKRKFGIKRERAPFVLTPDFVYVMGTTSDKQFKHFTELCIKAHSILRKHGSTFINLFAMMLSSDIPELSKPEDIDYLKDALCLERSEQETAKEFESLIYESLRLGWSTQLNWWIHNLKHNVKK